MRIVLNCVGWRRLSHGQWRRLLWCINGDGFVVRRAATFVGVGGQQLCCVGWRVVIFVTGGQQLCCVGWRVVIFVTAE